MSTSDDRRGHRRPTRVRLITWAASSAHPASLLPTLDPDGLYAASVLQARRGGKAAVGEIELEIQAPSSLLHDALPCLEDGQTGVILADSMKAIQTYSWKLAGRRGERSLLKEFDGEHDRQWAEGKALEEYVMANVHPLVHQVLFAKALFQSHTANVYGNGLGIVARQSMPSRLRRQLQIMYASRGSNVSPSSGLGPILREDNTDEAIAREEREERQDLVSRAGFDVKRNRKPVGLLREEKQEAGRAFGQLRIITFAEQVFGVVADMLGSGRFLSGEERPSLLDLRLFSLLAPLLLPVNVYPALAASPLPTLLRSKYPLLVEYTERIRLLLWPVRSTQRLDGRVTIETPDWPLLLSNSSGIFGGAETASSMHDEPLSIRMATSLGRMTSQAYLFSARLASRVRGAASSMQTTGFLPSNGTRQSGSGSTERAMSAAEQQDARMIRIGKYAWIASSLIVAIGTAFASGLLVIEIGEEDNDGEGNGDGITFASGSSREDGEEGPEERNGDEEGAEKAIVVEDEGGEDGEEMEEEEVLEEDEGDFVETDFDVDDDDG